MINYNHTDKKTKKIYLKNKQITHNPFDPTITSKSKDGEREREKKIKQTKRFYRPRIWHASMTRWCGHWSVSGSSSSFCQKSDEIGYDFSPTNAPIRYSAVSRGLAALLRGVEGTAPIRKTRVSSFCRLSQSGSGDQKPWKAAIHFSRREKPKSEDLRERSEIWKRNLSRSDRNLNGDRELERFEMSRGFDERDFDRVFGFLEKVIGFYKFKSSEKTQVPLDFGRDWWGNKRWAASVQRGIFGRLVLCIWCAGSLID